MKVDVYRNLHTGTWSVRHKGKVISHPTTVIINQAQFVVQPAGRARVLSKGRKNVHAFVRGEWDPQFHFPFIQGFLQVFYNPYQSATFQDKSGNPIYQARQVILTPDHKVFALI